MLSHVVTCCHMLSLVALDEIRDKLGKESVFRRIVKNELKVTNLKQLSTCASLCREGLVIRMCTFHARYTLCNLKNVTKC